MGQLSEAGVMSNGGWRSLRLPFLISKEREVSALFEAFLIDV
jgi:hypothetical protein